MKRIFVSTFFGFITGIICFLGGKYGLKDEISLIMMIYLIANRTLAGFIIGISSLKIQWAIHGTMIGFIAGIPFALGSLISELNYGVFIAALILGSIYGLIIEFFTTVVFKSKIV
ncbi:MAG: hypothetical protein JSV24_02610 [Bacteroidales bacterium]|nr:MAG: hypothetical protein JSV24_02610 [Bacteroidales bacterium]